MLRAVPGEMLRFYFPSVISWTRAIAIEAYGSISFSRPWPHGSEKLRLFTIYGGVSYRALFARGYFAIRFFTCRPPADDVECLQAPDQEAARESSQGKIEALVNRCGTRTLEPSNSLGIMLGDRFPIVVLSLYKPARTMARRKDVELLHVGDSSAEFLVKNHPTRDYTANED